MSAETCKKIIVDPVINQLNFETRFVNIANLDPEKKFENWISWVKKTSIQESNKVKSYLSQSGRYRFDYLKMMSERV